MVRARAPRKTRSGGYLEKSKVSTRALTSSPTRAIERVIGCLLSWDIHYEQVQPKLFKLIENL